MFDPFSMMVGAAGGLIESGVANHFQKEQSDRAHQHFVQDTMRNYSLSQSAQRNAVPNAVAGLKAAGLNPAAAVSGAFSAAPMSSPAMQSAPGVNARFPLADSANQLAQAEKTNALLDAQVENVQADTAGKLVQARKDLSQVDVNDSTVGKLKSEVDGLQIKNQQSKRELDYVNSLDASVFETMLKNDRPLIESWMNRVGLDITDEHDVETARSIFSAGALAGLGYAYGEKSKILDDALNVAVKERMLSDSQVQRAMARVPVNEQNELYSRIAHYRSCIEQLNALRDNLNASTAIKPIERTKMEKEISRLQAETEESYKRADTYKSQIIHNYASSFASVGVGVSQIEGAITDALTLGLKKSAAAAAANSKQVVAPSYGSMSSSARFPTSD